MNVNEMLAQEWVTLQNNHEQYEKNALLIKLASVVLTAVGFAVGLNGWLIGALIALLWVQEAVLRTFQARLGERILRVELLVRQSAVGVPAQTLQAHQAHSTHPADMSQPVAHGDVFQLHSDWLAARPGGVGLLAEYARSACRPTVAFPYAIILLLGVACVFFKVLGR